MRSTKTTVTISKKLLSDLLDMATFRVEELEDAISQAYSYSDQEGIRESKKRIAQTNTVIARATKVFDRTGGTWTI
jgi:hypothetical protein